jgi:hypothetical protein
MSNQHFTLHNFQQNSAFRTPTLEFANIFNAGTVHQGTPLLDFPIFVPLHTFSGKKFSKIGIYDPDLA